MIYNPITKDLYKARAGGGAYCNGKPIRVSNCKGNCNKFQESWTSASLSSCNNIQASTSIFLIWHRPWYGATCHWLWRRIAPIHWTTAWYCCQLGTKSSWVRTCLISSKFMLDNTFTITKSSSFGFLGNTYRFSGMWCCRRHVWVWAALLGYGNALNLDQSNIIVSII